MIWNYILRTGSFRKKIGEPNEPGTDTGKTARGRMVRLTAVKLEKKNENLKVRLFQELKADKIFVSPWVYWIVLRCATKASDWFVP